MRSLYFRFKFWLWSDYYLQKSEIEMWGEAYMSLVNEIPTPTDEQVEALVLAEEVKTLRAENEVLKDELGFLRWKCRGLTFSEHDRRRYEEYRAEGGRVMGDTVQNNQCEHGSLRRKCEICERDEEIAELKAEVERLQGMMIRWHSTGDDLGECMDGGQCEIAKYLSSDEFVEKSKED